MARGYKGAFGGTKINNPWLWGAFCLVFLIGLADLRRPFSFRNLDLVMLLSPTASLWYFNHGNVFTAVPLFYPALIWVVLRGVWIGVSGRGSPSRAVWPAWVLLAAAVFLGGFRIGLNVQASNVIDVGYSGVIGAERIVHGQAPWGNFPIEGSLKACGPGTLRERSASAFRRTAAANPQTRRETRTARSHSSRTSRAIALRVEREVGLAPAAHFTSIAFDLLCMLGLWLVGRRFGGAQLGAALDVRVGGVSVHPVRVELEHERRAHAGFPHLGLLARLVSGRPRCAVRALGIDQVRVADRGAALAHVPRPAAVGALHRGFVAATLAAFSVVLFEPSPLHELRVFWDRTVRWQVGRDAPWSLWDWGQYHARGLPNLHIVQRVLQGLLVAGALVVAFVPRRKSPLQLAALTAALLAGFELCLTYWLYTYIPWFFPFAAIAVLAPLAVVVTRPAP